jgi:hypothetical protein
MAARTSETLVNFYQTTQRYNPEDSHLRLQFCIRSLDEMHVSSYASSPSLLGWFRLNLVLDVNTKCYDKDYFLVPIIV